MKFFFCLWFIYFSMIVIDRKKISLFIVGICCFSAILCTNVKNVEESVLTSSTPVTSKVVILDAGHGKPDEGDCLLKLIP